MERTSFFEEALNIEVVCELSPEHLDTGLPVDDLCCGNDELLVLEELVQEANGCYFSVGDTSDEVNQHSFLPLLVRRRAFISEEL